jgi:hypothetical protein
MRANLNLLLANEGISPHSVSRLARQAESWFAIEPSIVSYAMYSMLREMERDWDIEQGIPTVEYESIRQSVLPHALNLTSGNLSQTETLATLDTMTVGLSNAMALSRPIE